MKPTQIYKPANFRTEYEKIYSSCTKVIENGLNSYYDSEGNRYRLDGCDQTVEVN